jgi:hypothetical protein
MLQQGRAIIDDFKGEAEGVVGQINEAKKQALGLWAEISGLVDWAKGLWASLTGSGEQNQKYAPQTDLSLTAAPQTSKGVEKKAKRRGPEPDPEPEIIQMQVIHDVSTRLGEFFDIQQKIKAHYDELEHTSLTVYEAGQNNAKKAIERVEVELQMEYLGVQIRETMVYAPKELKNLYSRFLEMYGRIEEEQEFARQEQLMRARYRKARKWQRRNFRIEMGMWAAGMAVVIVVLWAMMIQIAMLSGFSMECCSLQ